MGSDRSQSGFSQDHAYLPSKNKDRSVSTETHFQCKTTGKPQNGGTTDISCRVVVSRKRQSIHLEKTENASRTHKWIRHFLLCTKSDRCRSSSWIETSRYQIAVFSAVTQRSSGSRVYGRVVLVCFQSLPNRRFRDRKKVRNHINSKVSRY